MSRANQGRQGEREQGGQMEQSGATGQLKEKASEMAQSLRDMGSSVKDVAKEQYENVRDKAEEYYEYGRERAQEWQQQAEDYIREQPLKSVLIAAGVGILLGVIWRR
jgi:ElaB/YqjD/DUF883 family membrane-anchored ribosome-binding protein